MSADDCEAGVMVMMSCCASCGIPECDDIKLKDCATCDNLREEEVRRGHTCPFCREPVPSKLEECDKQRMKRIEVNDPVALCEEGVIQDRKGDYSSAFEYYTKAVKLGEVEAHCKLAGLYHNGHGVEKDRGKEVHHLEEAAIRGHPSARYNLGCHEWDNGNTERAVKHWIIAAAQGRDDAIIPLMDEFRSGRGIVSKDDLAAALRAHQAAVDATKSPQREAAEEYRRTMKSSK